MTEQKAWENDMDCTPAMEAIASMCLILPVTLVLGVMILLVLM
jgi:hypothetical protein